MSFKVAVASSDGKSINQHFGQAENFLIFEIEKNGNYKLIEIRKNSPPQSNPNFLADHDNIVARSTNLISDCEILLVSQIGPGAIKALLSRKIQPYAVSNMLIETAFNKLASSKLVSNPVPKPLVY